MSTNNKMFRNYEWEKRPCGNRKGYRLVYVYKGTWKRWELGEKGLLRYKLLFMALLISDCAAFIWGSSARSKLNFIKAVEVCHLAALAALVFLAVGILWFACSKKRLAEEDALLQKRLIAWSAGIEGAAMSLAVVAGAVAGRLDFVAEDLRAAAGFVLAIVFSAAILLLQKKLKTTDA